MLKKLLIAVATLGTIIAATEKSHTNSTFPTTGVANINGVNCSACHYNNAVSQGPGNVTITIANQAGPTYTYKVDTTYNVTVTVTDNTELRMGFEWAAVNSSNAGVGTVTLGNSTTEYLQTSGGIHYVSHHNANNTVKSWTFKWKAPASNVGTITFSCSGNATNNDNNTDGDNVYTTAIDLTYQPSAGINNLTTLNTTPDMYCYENIIHVKMPLYNTTENKLTVYDLNGRAVYTEPINTDNNISLSNLSNGMYIAVITSDNEIISSKKFIKQ